MSTTRTTNREAASDGHPRLPAVAVAVVGAVASAAVLHLAPDRAWAAGVAPIAVVWGLALHLVRLPRSAGVVLVSAVLVRAVLVGTPPLLSDDLYRYLWEGRLLLEGGNPFITPPSAVVGLDDPLRALVNHPEIPSIYPPLALWWFQLLASMGRTAVVAQAATAAVDLGIVALLLRSTRPSVRAGAALWALHPLPVLESAASAHIDIVALFLLAAALETPRARVLLAILGGATKLLPFAALPSLLARAPRRHWLAAALLGLVVCGSLASPILDAGPALFGALGTYARTWSFNPLLFGILEPLLGSATRLFLAGVGLVCTIAIWRTQDDGWTTMALVGAAFLAVSPTVHPWYVLWAFLPAAALGWRSWTLAASFFPASYAVLWTLDPESGAWSAGAWLAVLTWVPAISALAGAAYRPPNRATSA